MLATGRIKAIGRLSNYYYFGYIFAITLTSLRALSRLRAACERERAKYNPRYNDNVAVALVRMYCWLRGAALVTSTPNARELLDRYEASTTRSQYVSLVNLISSGHSFGQLAFVVR